MSARKCLPSAIALAWMAVTPALADDTFSAPPPDGLYNNLFSAPRPPAVAPPKYADWRGLYAGGQISYSDGTANFSNATEAPISYNLRETDLEASFSPSTWPVLGSVTNGRPGFGGFFGYNFEYLTPNMNVVLGIEGNFDIASLSMSAPHTPINNLLTTLDANDYYYLVSINGGGQASNIDWGTLRARAGWGIGNFLPYAFVGVALGNANVGATETITASGWHENFINGVYLGTSFLGTQTYTGTAGRDSAWLYGLTAGAGLDVAVSRNFFVRGEYEYVQFQPVSGVDISVNTVRLGGGVRF
jgi:outer membrane immunogenic protein